MNRKSFLITATLLAASITMLGARGPDGEKGSRQPQREGRPGDLESNPRVLRARLQMRLEETRRLEVRLQEAIARLDKGEGADVVLKDVENRQPDRADPRPDFREPPKPLSKQERDELFNFLKEHMPRAADRLKPGADHAEVTERVLSRFAPRIREVLVLKTSDPKLFTFRVDEMRATFDVLANTRDLGTAVRENKADAEEAAVAGIKDAVGRRFDAQLAAQRRELESLGGRMESLKAEIDRRSANRDAAVAEESDKTIERARRFEAGRANREKGQDPQGRPNPAGSR